MSTTLPAILLVDDDEVTRYLLRRQLNKLSLRGQILEAANGEQALALVKAHCQDCDMPQSLLILLDLNMPIMDGLEFLEHHAQLSPFCQQTTAVVVVSATPSKVERERARALAIEVKPKPLGEDDLMMLVRQHLPSALIA